jgi:hypothetical protein
MTEDKVDPKEYVEFLNWKKEKLSKEFNEQIAEIDKKISECLAGSSPGVMFSVPGSRVDVDNKGKRDTVGWKYLIDEVLQPSERYLSAKIIIAAVIKNPKMTSHIEVAKKSIASALYTNSAKDIGRYLVKTEKGKKVYLWNKEYKEKTAPKAV